MKKQKSAFGFLTVMEDPQVGLFGGYLVLNEAGRPLEFHCTAPIRPNRAQEILYGSTLRPYLYGEQIGQSLVAKSKECPLVICTDQRAALSLRPFVETPVALVLEASDESENREPPTQSELVERAAVSSEDLARPTPVRGFAPDAGGPLSRTRPPAENWSMDATPEGSAQLTGFRLGANRLAVVAQEPDDRLQVAEHLGQMAEFLDLGEPFQRIREAIGEARAGA